MKKISQVPVIFWIGLFTILVIGGGLFLVLKTQGQGGQSNEGQAKAAKLLPGVVEFQSLGAAHIQPGSAHQQYNSNPPTSGPHYPQPANWGIYENQLADETLLHNLEHGGIWVSYKPDLPDDQKAKLKEIAGRYKSKVILEPRVQNDSPIALVAWQRLLKLDNADEKRITQFISTYKNLAPERFPD